MKHHFFYLLSIIPLLLLLGCENLTETTDGTGDTVIQIVTPTWLNETKIRPSDGFSEQHYGGDISINGDYAIIGALRDNDLGMNSGAVYIYRRTDTGQWGDVKKITVPDSATSLFFGASVAICGDYAVVGSTYDDDKASNAGAAYIFHRTGMNVWGEYTKITASDGSANCYFGTDVDIQGDYVIVGGTGENRDRGAAYIFRKTGDNNWDSGTKITAINSNDYDKFGTSVSISGDYAIVGAIEDGPTRGNGFANIYHRTDVNSWNSGTKLIASDGASGDFYGGNVAICGDYAVISSSEDDDDGSASGSAYIYHRTDTNSWTEENKITVSDAIAMDHFGTSVDIEGEYVIVGAIGSNGTATESGTAYIYQRKTGNSWDEIKTLIASDGEAHDSYGTAVNLDGVTVLVSALYEGDTDNVGDPAWGPGAVYFYE